MNYDKGAILAAMDQAFNNDDVDELCFHLDIDREHLDRTNKRTRIMDLILHCERRNRLANLLHECQKMRPVMNWNLVSDSQEQNLAFANDIGLTNYFDDEHIKSAFEVTVHRQVWQALDELKESGQRLWILASPQNVADFAYRLQTANAVVGINQELFEPTHFSALTYLFKKMGDYRAGKETLLRIRGEQQEEQLKWMLDKWDAERLQINLNHKFKQQYEDLLHMVASDFKRGLVDALSRQ